MIIDRGDGSTCSILFREAIDVRVALFQVRLRFLDSIFVFPSGEDERPLELIESIRDLNTMAYVQRIRARVLLYAAAVWETKKVNGDGIKGEGTSETRR